MKRWLLLLLIALALPALACSLPGQAAAPTPQSVVFNITVNNHGDGNETAIQAGTGSMTQSNSFVDERPDYTKPTVYDGGGNGRDALIIPVFMLGLLVFLGVVRWVTWPREN